MPRHLRGCPAQNAAFFYANLSTMLPQRPHAFDTAPTAKFHNPHRASRPLRVEDWIITARSAPIAPSGSLATIASWSAPSAATT
jgi:hypothetical protein